MIRTKRVYDMPTADDGFRILVDRLWPRALSKQNAQVGLWLKDIAPSDELRKWFAHDPQKWFGFKEKYFGELDDRAELVELIIEKVEQGDVTLLYGTRNEELNNAVALREYVEARMQNSSLSLAPRL